MGEAKLTSRDILRALLHFGEGDDSSLARQVQNIKRLQPTKEDPVLYTFSFHNQKYFLLIDNTLDNDEVDIYDTINDLTHDGMTLSSGLLSTPESGEHRFMHKGLPLYLAKKKSNKKRLDAVLSQQYPELSRARLQKYIKEGRVTVNGTAQLKPSLEINSLDSVKLDSPKDESLAVVDLPIIYQDDDVAVIDKPYGVLTHAKNPDDKEFSVADFFKKYHPKTSGVERPGIVHRLDRDTSGVLIGAKNLAAADNLKEQFSQRSVSKTYIAIVKGVPKLTQALIDIPISRSGSNPGMFLTKPNGKSAQTAYKVLAINKAKNLSLVELKPTTGRTHQLRVHMNHIGTPILGDRLYDKNYRKQKPTKRMFLHARELALTLPSGSKKTFTSVLPAEFYDFFKDFKEKQV